MPDISKLPQLAEVFGCSVDELLGDKSGLLEAALKGEEQEYAQENDIPLEELETVVPVLKPDQVDGVANAVLAKNGEGMEVFYPFLTEETMRKLAERKLEKGESICTMLPFLAAEYLGEVALGQEEQGKEYCTFSTFKNLKSFLVPNTYGYGKRGCRETASAAISRQPHPDPARSISASGVLLIPGQSELIHHLL